MTNRNIILGLDGVPFELIDNLSNKGIMPNFNELKKDYTFKSMRSSIPHISSVSWSSIITGKNPGEHGIYGFSEIIENTYSLRFPNFNALKSKPFWHKEPEKRYVIINVPFTYPARELNGIHIAGFVALDLEKAVYPKKILPILKRLNYEIDIDTKIAQQQSIDIFFDELIRILNIRKKTFELFWNKLNWDNFLGVITGSDRIGHFLWHIYEDDTNQYHHRFLEFFREIDNIIGDINNRLKEDDKFIILSDHGMEQIKQNVNLNTYLEREGYLRLSENLKKYNRIIKASKAFVLEPGRVYLNKKGKFPNGSVDKESEIEVIDELKIIFDDLKFNKQKIIKYIYEKKDVYTGKMLNRAPDLILIENKGFNLKSSIGKIEIFEEENKFSGKHNENAFIFVNRDIDLRIPTVENIIGLLR